MTLGPATRVRVVRFGPRRPWSAPGRSVSVKLELLATRRVTVTAAVELLDLDRVVDSVEARFRLPAGSSRRRVTLRLPTAERRGYGLGLRLAWPDGRQVAGSAVEALRGWWESPRHAAITEFHSPAATARALTDLREWHVTVVQDYDWMYRHYRYSPPSGSDFEDALGRRVSHRAVAAGIRAGHESGIATLAYGSVYGAEREYVETHPDERVFDEAGVALSLGETFYINDLRPGEPWRARLLDEYVAAIRTFGFDGIHMDTYGPPHRAVSADGAPIDFAALYPGLIAEAAERVADARAGSRVLFNCVEGFPLETVATAPAAVIYLELWPPDVRYRDVVGWIERARRLGAGRAVVIAAYISALRAAGDDASMRGAASEAAVVLTSVITAAGAYHHLIAEGARVLVEGYYPVARRMGPSEAAELRAAWVFGARYLHLLSDPGLAILPLDGVGLFDGDGRELPLCAEPVGGAIWARATTTGDGTRVLQLIDLRAGTDDHWDAGRVGAPMLEGVRLCWSGAVSPVAMSPWTGGGAATALQPSGDGGWRLPAFRRWLMVADPAR